MPSVLFLNGFRFFFYSLEGNEPMHIHIQKADANGKVWIEPEIKIAYLHDFTNADKKFIEETIQNNIVLIKTKWNEHFGK